MNKDQDVKDARAKYIQDVVNNSKKSVAKTVKALSKELYISERTIYYDFAKEIKK